MSNTARAHRSTADDITGRGAAVLRDAKLSLEGVVEDVSEKGREVVRAVGDVRDRFADALLDSIRTHPYASLAVAGLIGFAYGALRRR